MRFLQNSYFLFILVFALLLGSTPVSAESYQKTDLVKFFQKLEAGQQVNVVTIGGSITMHRTGWALKIVDKMREAYPQADVNFINAGVSGTGSNLGLFRLGRDVIAHRPDLVVIEFAVNDGGTPDETCIRNIESIVTRLQQLPHPPAIAFLESAAQNGVSHERHNAVAAHYNLLDVDTQSAVDSYLAEHSLEWDALFSDSVHPNDQGHELYASTLWQAMLSNLALPEANPPMAAPSKPLSDELILNATLITPNFKMHGWDYWIEPENGWWRRFFQTSLQSGNDASTLHIPFYGRTIGVWLLTLNASGRVRLAVDGQLIKDMSAQSDRWYYSAYVHPELFKEDWHVLSIIPVEQDDTPARVRIGYLLAEDQNLAPEPSTDFWQTTWLESHQKTEGMSEWNWRTLPVEDWQIIGPFGTEQDKPYTQPEIDLNRDFGVAIFEAPDREKAYSGYQDEIVHWKTGSGKLGWVDLREIYQLKDRGLAYAYHALYTDKAGTYNFRLAADYFVYAYVNGVLEAKLLELHGNPQTPVSIDLPLKEGINHIWLKVHAGSMGFGFRLEYPIDAGIQPILDNIQ